MARFRCPRCGAIVEGVHDRCPRCKVLFKYRKEDVEELTPFKAPEVAAPEKLPEPEPQPVVEEAAEVKPEVIEAPLPPAVIEQPKPQGPSKEEIAKKSKKGTASLIFGILGFVFSGLLTWILGLIFSIVGMVQASKSKPYGGKKATVGKVFGIIGLIFSILSALLALLIITAAVIGLIALLIYMLTNPEIIQQIQDAMNGGGAVASMML